MHTHKELTLKNVIEEDSCKFTINTCGKSMQKMLRLESE